MRITSKILGVFVTVFYGFLWLPVIVLVFFSFSNNKHGLSWEGFTLKWYSAIFNNVAIREALLKSLSVASVTVLVATALGTWTAYGLYKYKFLGRRVLRTSVLLPIIMPAIVTGSAFLVFFVRILHVPLGYISILLAHITFSAPLARIIHQ